MKERRRLPDAELEIMMIVWDAGEEVRSAEIAVRLQDRHDWAATTVLGLLSRLVARGFLSCRKDGKHNVYAPLVGREEYLQQEGRSLLERLYGNSLRGLMASLYDGKAIDDDDLAELQRFIEEKTKEEH